MKIGVTGANGLVGWHMRCCLLATGHEGVPAGRETFADDAALDSFVSQCDTIIHLAGMNT